MLMDKTKFCVTAISRLTRQREVVTPPCSLRNAIAVRDRTLSTPAAKRSYIYPTVRIYSYYLDHPPAQAILRFND